MNELFEQIAAQPIFWVAGVIAAVMCVGSLFASPRPDKNSETCGECGCYGGGHFSWCSRAFHAGEVA